MNQRLQKPVVAMIPKLPYYNTDAVEYVISIFRAPLEASGMRVASIEDELEDVVDFARKYLTTFLLSIIVRFGTSFILAPDSERWPNVLVLSALLFSLHFTTKSD